MLKEINLTNFLHKGDINVKISLYKKDTEQRWFEQISETIGEKIIHDPQVYFVCFQTDERMLKHSIKGNSIINHFIDYARRKDIVRLDIKKRNSPDSKKQSFIIIRED